MKKLKSIFCEAFSDYKGTNIYHIDEITHANFKGRELFNFADLYAGRAEYAYGKKHRQAAFNKGFLLGTIVGFISCLICIYGL